MDSTIKVVRKHKADKTTTGRLYLGGLDYCYTLEDEVRGPGEKVQGETAIPAGEYQYIVNLSNRFKRKMILIFSDPKDLKLKNNGVEFAGVRVHGGNKHTNTEGCVLVAHRQLDSTTIQGTAEKDVTEWAIAHGSKGKFIVVDEFEPEASTDEETNEEETA